MRHAFVCATRSFGSVLRQFFLYAGYAALRRSIFRSRAYISRVTTTGVRRFDHRPFRIRDDRGTCRRSFAECLRAKLGMPSCRGHQLSGAGSRESCTGFDRIVRGRLFARAFATTNGGRVHRCRRRFFPHRPFLRDVSHVVTGSFVTASSRGWSPAIIRRKKRSRSHLHPYKIYVLRFALSTMSPRRSRTYAPSIVTAPLSSGAA